MRDKKVKAVILDWAGTTVDFGCMAPAKVFLEVFKEQGINVDVLDARKPMGMNKRDHIREVLKMEHISELWKEKFGKDWNENDVDELYKEFIPKQLEILKNYSDLVPETLEVQKKLREQEIVIGSTTGYNAEMMEIVIRKAEEQGYIPDVVITSSDVPTGRPSPWMAVQAAMELGVYPLQHIVKVGDTIADIEEGINAGMWSVGVMESSNEIGLTLDEYKSLEIKEQKKLKENLRAKYRSAGAHAVISNLNDLPELIERINNLLKTNIKPQPIYAV